MMIVKWIILMLCVPTAWCQHNGLGLLLPEEKQYTYFLSARVTTSSASPSDQGNSWSVEGRLYVRPAYNYTTARFKLSLTQTSLNSQGHGFRAPYPTVAKYLQEAWDVEYLDNGYISSLYVGTEPIWATNMKRAISTNFQIRNQSGTYDDEPCLYSKCEITYIVEGNRIKKYNSITSILTDRSWSSVPLVVYPDYSQYTDAITSAERVYELDDKIGLVKMDLRGEFQYKTHDHILNVATDLSLSFDTTTPSRPIDKLNLTVTMLQYVAHDSTDALACIRDRSQGQLKNRTAEILMKIAKTGIDTDNIVKNATLIHSVDFIDLLNTMTQLTYDSLMKLFSELVLGTSYDVETSRNILLEVLPHVRTSACARFVKYLVVKQKEKIEDATLLSLVRKLPFNVANHSQDLLEELEVFTKLSLDFSQEIRHAAILSFATLVNKARSVWRVKTDYFDNVVVKYFRMYSDCPQYSDRLVWLQGLCNLGFAAESYTRIVYGDGGRDRHERLWAGLALTQGPVEFKYNDPAVPVLESTLTILTNETENIQLRISALHAFLSSNIRASDFMYVHNYIKGSSNNQLKRFWYTTVKSLETAKGFKGYPFATHYIPFISSQVTNPDSTFWASSNSIITTGEDDAASLQVLTIGEPLTGLPGFMGFKVNTGGRRPLDAALYIIAEGLTTTMFRKMKAIDPVGLNMDKLVQILKQMKVQFVEPERVHIDIVMKIHDKTVYSTHVNETWFDNWNGEDLTKSIEDILRFGSHINQQMVYYPYQLDVNFPTELGTPIRLQSTIVSFTSIRGNLTAPSKQDFTWKNDLHIRYLGTSVTWLSTEGPVLKSDHSSRIQQSLVAHVPIKFDITIEPLQRTIKIRLPNPGSQHGGIAMHSRTQMSLDSDSLKKVYTVVNDDSNKSEENGIFFDCERPMSGSELTEKLWTTRKIQHDLLTSLQPSSVILNAVRLLMSPSLGSCGIIFPPTRIIPSGDNTLLLEFTAVSQIPQHEDDNVNWKLKYSITFVKEQIPEPVFNISGHLKIESLKGNSSIELMVAGRNPGAEDPAWRNWKICFLERDLNYASLERDITKHPASYEGQISITYTPEDNSSSCPNDRNQLAVYYKGVPIAVNGSLERRFEIKLAGDKMPELNKVTEDILKESFLGQVLPKLDSNFNISAVIKEKNGLASVKVNSQREVKFQSEQLPWIVDSWSNMQIMKKIGIYRECRISDTSIATLLGNTDQLPDLKCNETLALADCTHQPRFAVFLLKSGGVKVYTGGNYVTVGGDPAVVTINGNRGCDGDCVFPNGDDEMYTGPEDIYDVKITRLPGTVKVFSRVSGVHVYYKTTETYILVPHTYMETGCGLCSNQHYYNIC